METTISLLLLLSIQERSTEDATVMNIDLCFGRHMEDYLIQEKLFITRMRTRGTTFLRTWKTSQVLITQDIIISQLLQL